MTDDDAKALGLRAVACPKWRPLPGVVDCDGVRVLRVGEHTVDATDPRARLALPDFRDPATMGAALAVWQSRPGHDYRCPCPVLTYAAVYGLTDRRTIAALVAALEAAGARVSP